MTRNGVNFGIRIAETEDEWHIAPGQYAKRSVLYRLYSEVDGNPDIGDSAITETVGVVGNGNGCCNQA